MKRALPAVLILSAWSSSAQTAGELRARITDRDRRISELAGQIERLRYAAGTNVATGEVLTPHLHNDTLVKVDKLSQKVDATADSAKLAQDAAIGAAVAAALANDKLDQAKQESSKTLIEAISSQVVVLLTVIIGFWKTDRRERRNHKWAIEADDRRQQQLKDHKLDVNTKLETITALLDGSKAKTHGWLDLPQ